MTKRANFLTGAGILTVALFGAKIIGAFYRIPLTNILGSEGMGVYQLVFPIYSFLLSTSSGALPVAISLLVSEKKAVGDDVGAKKILVSAMSVLMLWAVLIAMALVLLCKPLGSFQGNTDTYWGYLAIAPAIFFVSGIALLRGWFQGNGYMTPTAISQISEAVVKLCAGLTCAYFLAPYGIAYAVGGAMFGVTISEVVTFIILYIMYRKNNSALKLNFNFKEAKDSYKSIVKISIPITIGGMILPLTQIIDSVLVVNILSSSIGTALATSSYGIYSGYVATIINLPIVLGLSLGIAVIPQISKGKASHDIAEIKNNSDTVVKFSLIIGVPFMLIYALAARSILTLLFPSLTETELSEAIILLQIGSFSVVGLSVTQIYTSILQGVGATYSPTINMAIGALVKTVLNVVLLYYIGIYGVAVSSVVCYTLVAVLNISKHAKLLGKSKELVKNSGIILLAGVIMGVIIATIRYFAFSNLASVGAIILGGIIYIAILLQGKVFNERELKHMPFIAKLAIKR
ncbi:MAG: polysaccharide biosynthesis protein [Bacillota bacterium]